MKVVVIASGGLDSTVLMHHLSASGHDVLGLGINYGQRHSRELQAGVFVSALLGLPYRIADLSGIRELIANSSQTGAIEVPEGHYAEASMKQTVVPNRNMILLSVAIGYAVNIGADAVAYGAHAGDHAIYPDCRPEFAAAMSKLYLWKFRNIAAFNEQIVAQIADEFFRQIQPRWVDVTGKFAMRGGISVSAVANRGAECPA